MPSPDPIMMLVQGALGVVSPPAARQTWPGSANHLLALAVGGAVVFAIVAWGLRLRRRGTEPPLRRALGWIGLAGWLTLNAYYLIALWGDPGYWSQALPLHVCDLANLLAAGVMLQKVRQSQTAGAEPPLPSAHEAPQAHTHKDKRHAPKQGPSRQGDFQGENFREGPADAVRSREGNFQGRSCGGNFRGGSCGGNFRGRSRGGNFRGGSRGGNFRGGGVLYFWAFALTAHGLVTPVVEEGLGDPRYWLFWLNHFTVVGYAIYDVVVGGYRPRFTDLLGAIAVTLGYVAVVLPIDLITGWNYGFVGPGRPDSPTILDALGPWPGRLGWLTLLGLGSFVLVWLPWPLGRLLTRRR